MVREYSNRLSQDIGAGYGISNLKRMRQFFLLIEKGVALQHQLSWNHFIALIPINDVNKINYYINITIINNYSYRSLREIIKSKDYERLPEDGRKKLVNKEALKAEDFIKNPILIKNIYDHNEISEKILKNLILEDIDNFLLELGNDFCYIKNEYKIKIGNSYNFIDLLLFNIEFNCYVVIELKVTELKKEHIGQIQIYMNYINNNLKKFSQAETIGIIICKKDNKFILEYCSDKRILTREYELM